MVVPSLLISTNRLAAKLKGKQDRIDFLHDPTLQSRHGKARMGDYSPSRLLSRLTIICTVLSSII